MEEIVEKQPAPAKKPATAVRVLNGVLKSLAIVLGLPLTVLSLMSVIGLATDNLWIRLIPAVIVALGVPLFIVDRLLPDDDSTRARGMPTDMLALIWFGFAVIFIGLAHPVTSSLLIAEADRYAVSGTGSIAQATYWMGGATPTEPVLEPSDAGAGDGDAGATAATDGEPAGEAGTAETPDAGADGGATPSADGSVPDAEGGGARDASPAKTSGDAAAKTYTPAELFQKVSPAVVTISARDNYNHESSGTGFFIDEDGTIATNQHVIKRAASVGVKLIGKQYSGGHRWLHEVELLVEDRDADLALLRVPPQRDITPLILGDSEKVAVGERVICIGNPLGLEHTLSDGLISARRMHKGRRWIQMSAPISPGNSGGPVITLTGDVIGVATATVNRVFRDAQNLNLAVPVNTLKALIRDDYPDRRQFDVGPGGPSTW